MAGCGLLFDDDRGVAVLGKSVGPIELAPLLVVRDGPAGRGGEPLAGSRKTDVSGQLDAIAHGDQEIRADPHRLSVH
jgi:hypothetical protein